MRAQMKKALPVLFAGMILGLLLGFGVGRFFSHCHQNYNHRMERFISELKLDDLQEAKVREVLQEQRRQMKSLKEELKPRFEAIHEEGLNKIKQELTPQQQVKLDEIEKRKRHKRKELSH